MLTRGQIYLKLDIVKITAVEFQNFLRGTSNIHIHLSTHLIIYHDNLFFSTFLHISINHATLISVCGIDVTL